jgi:hypothetical protein
MVAAIAVGLPVAQQPPHRSRRADYSHRALHKYSLPQGFSCHYRHRTLDRLVSPYLIRSTQAAGAAKLFTRPQSASMVLRYPLAASLVGVFLALQSLELLFPVGAGPDCPPSCLDHCPARLLASAPGDRLVPMFLPALVHSRSHQADRGSSMTSKPVAFLMADLGVTKTHSRPHVFNDNPYSEAQFKM